MAAQQQPHRRRLAALALLASPALVACNYPGSTRGWRGMSEQERANAYAANGYQWPPAHATKGWPPVPVPESEGYARSRDQIESMIRKIDTYKLRWDEWFNLVQTRLMPSFTPVGFKKMKAPQHLFEKLNASYYANLGNTRQEHFSHNPNSGIPTDLLPNFISQGRLNNEIMHELKPIHEEWAGVDLNYGQSYGVRVYKNGSTLVNHVDRSETHVISCIFHIAHDLDEPWPLEIEDHDGVVHAVNMEPGDMVMYESAKQFHARMTPMRGRHYGSLFIHYYPAHDWNWTMWDVHVAVPPHFLDTTATSTNGTARDEIFELGRTPLMQYYHEYWDERGEGFVPPAMGIDTPVQTMSHAAFRERIPLRHEL